MHVFPFSSKKRKIDPRLNQNSQLIIMDFSNLLLAPCELVRSSMSSNDSMTMLPCILGVGAFDAFSSTRSPFIASRQILLKTGTEELLAHLSKRPYIRLPYFSYQSSSCLLPSPATVSTMNEPESEEDTFDSGHGRTPRVSAKAALWS